MTRLVKHLLIATAPLLMSAQAHAAINLFQGDLAGFNAAAGTPAVAVSFDALSGNIDGSTINGVTFSSPDGNSLEVVDGASTFTAPGFGGVIDANTNRLLPTTGAKVLSPGGLSLVPGSALGERDSLQLVFGSAQSAFGIDILFQSYDFAPFLSYTAYDTGNNVLASGGVLGGSGGGGAPGAALFFGIVSNDPSTHISRVVFTESDGDANFPDANVGYDTLRFGRGAGAVPEPATWAMMLLGFGVMGAAIRRQRQQAVRVSFI